MLFVCPKARPAAGFSVRDFEVAAVQHVRIRGTTGRGASEAADNSVFGW